MCKVFLKILYITIVSFLIACDNRDFPGKQAETSLVLITKKEGYVKTNSDDLPEEYEIKNLSIYLAATGSNIIQYKYVHQSFSSTDDPALLGSIMVALPLDPSTLAMMDIYVIVNCPDLTSLNAIQTVNDIQALRTPAVSAANILTTTWGLPMYGESLNTNLSNTSADNPTPVELIRTCSKLQITLIFTDDSWIGTENKYMIEYLAPYTLYAKNDNLNFDAFELISYPQADFTWITSQRYQAVTYVYESMQLPRMHIYTTIDGNAKEYIAGSNFPLPVRNYLYDIQVQIHPPLNTKTKLISGNSRSPDIKTEITIWE
ncbi:MAG: hypothetical protein LBT43_02930 [Prevotella sp.]|jgi:hypothetical protein|nr:hypothetical protein [Prevotella sp.]MDR2001488.1 hypothetical protein [Prevotella sp.]